MIFPLFAIDFYLLIWLFNFFADTNQNWLIFYSMDFSWSLLFENIYFPNFLL